MAGEYSYAWKGFFKYKEGNWFYTRKQDWRIDSSKIPLNEYASLLLDVNVWQSIICKLKHAGVNISDELCTHEFLLWLTKDDYPDLHVGRALEMCLKHFAEEITSKQYKDQESCYIIVSSFVKQNATIHIKANGPGDNSKTLSWFFLSPNQEQANHDIVSEYCAQYVMALPELFFNEKNIQRGLMDNLSEAACLFKSHRIVQKVTVRRVEASLLEFKNEGLTRKYRKGLLCGCLPIPGEEIVRPGCEPATVKNPEIVVTSPNVVKALSSLSQIWQDKFAKSVLISAPPGSGKEQFSKSIAYSLGRNVIIRSLAEGTTEQLEKILYGHNTTFYNKQDGLIKKAEGGVLFLDEVHHPEESAGIRGSLLRVLESDRFTPVGSEKSIDINNVLFVLATSKPLKGRRKEEKGLNDIQPPDFWTRMTHVITIKHPFEGVWGELFEKILDSYFIFFWWDRLEKFFKIDPETDRDLEGTASPEAGIDDLNHNYINNLKYRQRLDQMKKIGDEDYLLRLAQAFRERFTFILGEERIQPNAVSVRGLRNIVTRIFSISAALISQGSKVDGYYLNILKREIDAIIYEILEIATLNS